MVSFEKHLVSQRLGRVRVVVDVDAHGKGKVTLCPEQAAAAGGTLDFSMEELLPLCGKGNSWVDLVARLAVSQAHRLYRKKEIDEPLSGPLRINGRPWVGDLLASPFGGATTGVEEQPSVPKPRGFGIRRYL
jgi:hypothetical protein